MINNGKVLVMNYDLFTTPSSDHAKFINLLFLDSMDLTNIHLDKLLGRCSILKSLKIFACKGVTELRIYHLCLKLVTIEYCASVRAMELSCSNLQEFAYVGEVISIHFTDVPHLEKITYTLEGTSIPADYVFNALFESFSKHPTTVLDLNVTFMGDVEKALLCPLSSHFTNLLKLVVDMPKTQKDLLWLVYLLESAPCLEDLHVAQTDAFSQIMAIEEAPGTISKPSLVVRPHNKLLFLMISGFSGHTSEIELILCILKCATSLRDVSIKLAYPDSSTDPYEIERATEAHLKIARARERAHQYLQNEISSQIGFRIF